MTRPVPESGEHEVEVDLPGEIDWSDVVLDPDEPQGFRQEGSSTVLIGLVDDVGHDGVAILRLTNVTFLLDTVGEPPLDVIGRSARIPVATPEIYPVAL